MIKYNKNKIRFGRPILLGFISIYMLFSCQEPYTNEDLNANEKIPVINGVFTNIDNLTLFTLSYAKPYSSNTTEYISDATVSIINNSNQEIMLEPIGYGDYKLPEGHLPIEPNMAYTAKVILNNGTVIKSEPMQIYEPCEIEGIFYLQERKTSLVKDANGNYNEISMEGISISFSLVPIPDETIYLRSNANYYVHAQEWATATRSSQKVTNNYTITYELRYDTLYDTYEGHANTDFPVVAKLQEGINYSSNDLTFTPLFLLADEDAEDFSLYTENEFIEWIFPVDVYRTSAETYNYYLQVQELLEPTGQIFDPIPTEIKGNLYNDADQSETVLGWFDACSVNRKYFSVYVRMDFSGPLYASRYITDTVIRGGRYPSITIIDTLSIDSVAH